MEVQRSTSGGQIAGIVVSAAAGFGLGLVAGVILGELLGGVDAEWLRRAVDRWRPEVGTRAEPRVTERAVRRALKANPGTRFLRVRPRALHGGLLELVGTVPTEQAREAVGATARDVARGYTVVNRVLVEGRDVPAASEAPAGTDH